MSLENMIKDMTRAGKEASRELRKVARTKKDAALGIMADKLTQREKAIRQENERDLVLAKEQGMGSAMLDRLALDSKTLQSMAEALREVVALPDPVGEVTGMWKRPNGLQVGRVRIPLGLIGFIYESRPNVTVDAASLCLKAGNAVILKGGSEAIRSNLILGQILGEALQEAGLPRAAIQVIPTTERDATRILLQQENDVDVIIPRGGEGLIRFVTDHSRIPVLRHYKGVCHIYVDEFADLTMAAEICFNAKVQRPAVCNAMETMLVHEKVADGFLPAMLKRFHDAGVEIRGCPKTLVFMPEARPAEPEDWPAEFSDLILAVKVVRGMDEALDHIETYGSNHTEAIVTKN
jgi:glutamate-5-semialdehyde dehydrogenase